MADKQIQNAAAKAPPKAAGRKVGEGHLTAMARLGGHEITQALQAFPDSNIRPMEEPGVFGNPTQQVITQDMGYQKMLDSYSPPKKPIPQKETEQER